VQLLGHLEVQAASSRTPGGAALEQQLNNTRGLMRRGDGNPAASPAKRSAAEEHIAASITPFTWQDVEGKETYEAVS
jgi:hypothetical protein